MIGYLYLLLAILATALGQILLKQHSLRDSKISVKLIIAISLFLSIPIFTYLSLKTIHFAIVFLSDSLAITLIVIFSKYFLNERISFKKIYGIICILSGIILLNWSLNG